MRTTRPSFAQIVSIALVLGIACSAFPAEPAEVVRTWDDVREAGRAKSRFLNEAMAKPEPTTAVPTANLNHFQKSIESVLAQKCSACHGATTAKANFRIDRLNPDLLTGADTDRWRAVYKVLSNSEMPPGDATKYYLADADRTNIVDWLGQELGKASLVRRTKAENSSFRRMTKYEYNYALQDLLGLSYPIANSLPPETPSEDGFKNSSDLLQMSASQFEAYRELGLKALKRVTVQGDRPQPITYIHEMRSANDPPPEKKDSKAKPKPLNPADKIHRTPLEKPYTLARSAEVKMDMDRFLPDEGTMRVRIRVGRTTNEPNEYASLRLVFSAHTSNNANFSQVVSQRDLPVTASADKPEILEFDIPLSEIQRNPFRKSETPFPRRNEFLHIRHESNAARSKTPLQVVIDSIEVSAPHFDQWPPRSHTEIFFASPNKVDEQAYGREVLGRFLERAWRRPVTPDDIAPYLALFAKYRADFNTFEGAMIEVLATALASPEFLYITQKSATPSARKTESISDTELASRLSFFLWSSIPDAELQQLARKGTLKNPDVLKAQVQRMLADPRAERFSQQFVEQWLGLDGMDNATHVKDESLRDAMRQEPVAFFREALRANSSILDFLHSDYVVVNERLAPHYGIPGVFGPHFRKVPSTDQVHRGGLLTAAGLLAMNAEGADSHPLKRGIWLLKRVLHDPPPPPPPDVPQVDLTDPRILQMTLKERIADHRNKPACVSCHSRIDPWGIAFENYDALGAWRTMIKKTPVDATAVLFNKQELAGVDGLKRYLLSDRQDQFARAMIHKMSAYALGRPLTFADHADIDAMTSRFRKQGDRLADLIHVVVTSNLFHSKS